MIKKFFAKDSHVLIILFVLGITGIWLFLDKKDSVFPNASIDLTISKSDISKTADEWADRLDYDKKPLIKSITFNGYDDSKTFLEYELGNAQANELMHNTVPIFYWFCTYRKAFDQETLDIAVSPAGKLIYFEYDLPNDKKLPSIDHDEAQKRAFAFVKEINGWQEEDCKLIDDDETQRLNRIDHDFTWEYQKLDWHNAKLRAAVDLSGNKLTGFSYYLHRPQKWDRDYSTIRSKNNLLESIASIFYVLLYPTAAFIFLRGLSEGAIRWRFALTTGAVFTLIYLIEAFNNFPTLLISYSPESSLKAFIIKSTLSTVLYAPLLLMIVATMAGAGELVYSKLFPNKIALEKILTIPGLRSKEVFIGLIAGILWFAVGLGYQICYYGIGKQFHFWCPLEVNNYQVLSTYFPWFSAVDTGAFASGNEEILYRVLMLGLTKIVVRRFWLANFLQAVAWGFMHSTYPQQPCYARGLELTIEGVFDGWLLNRFGLLACIVAHYSFDAFYSIVPLLNASPAQALSACFPFAPIIIATFYSFFASRKQKPVDETLLNKTVVSPAPNFCPIDIIKANLEESYQALTKNIRWSLLTLIVFGFLIYLIIGDPTYDLGETSARLQATQDKAIQNAKEYLENSHIDINSYKVSTLIGNNFKSSREQEDLQYVYEQIGFDRTKKITEEIEHPFLWVVKFIKPLTPSEYDCYLDENGKIIALDITRDENEPGANLSQHKAQIIAENFLSTYCEQYSPFELKDASKTKRKNRTDYHFTFKVPKYKVGEADFEVSISTIGDIPANLSHSWDVPDKWTWERLKQTKLQEISVVIHSIFKTAVVIAAIIWIILLFKSNKIRWRKALFIATLLVIGFIIDRANELPEFFNSYDSTTPLNTFYVTYAIGHLVNLALVWGLAVFGIAVVLAGNSWDLKHRVKNLLVTLITIPQDKPLSKLYRDLWLDAILLTIAAQTAFWLINSIENPLILSIEHEVGIAAISPIADIVNKLFGPLGVATSLLWQVVFVVSASALIIAICRQLHLTTFWKVISCVVLVHALGDLGIRYWQDFVCSQLTFTTAAICCWIFIMHIARRNILALFLMPWIIQAYGITSEFWKFGYPTFYRELIISFVFLIYPFLYLLYLHTRIINSKSSPKLTG